MNVYSIGFGIRGHRLVDLRSIRHEAINPANTGKKLSQHINKIPFFVQIYSQHTLYHIIYIMTRATFTHFQLQE